MDGSFYYIGNSFGISYVIKCTSCIDAQLAERKLLLCSPFARGDCARAQSFYVNKNGDAIFISYKREKSRFASCKGQKGPTNRDFCTAVEVNSAFVIGVREGNPRAPRKIPDMEDENKYERRIMV